MRDICSVADLKFEFRLIGDGVPAADNTREWLFTIAEELHYHRKPLLPPEWGFRPSPLGPPPERFEAAIVRRTESRTLLRFGHLLHRYWRRFFRCA